MIDRLPEINRVLQMLHLLGGAGPEARIPIDSLIAMCKEIVFEGRMPDHEATIEFVLSLGLIYRTENHAGLTSEGLTFLSLNPELVYELTPDQARFLVRKHYLDGGFGKICHGFFRCFSISYETDRLQWSEADGPKLPVDYWLINHLIQLGVIHRGKGVLYTSETYHQVIAEFLEQPKGITEEQLKQFLKEKEEVGELAEQLVLEYEKCRLANNAFIVEAQCVRRVSKLRVNAGFDIESFDCDSQDMAFDRFIEVKGAKQTEVRFFWSENEMKVAEKLGDNYWIYFQGGINMASKKSTVLPLLFQNPFQSVLGNAELTKTPQGFLVQGKQRGAKL